MSSWRKAGFTFNKYVAISSRTLRSVLKDDLKAASDKRDVAEVKIIKFENGVGKEPEALSLTK